MYISTCIIHYLTNHLDSSVKVNPHWLRSRLKSSTCISCVKPSLHTYSTASHNCSQSQLYDNKAKEVAWAVPAIQSSLPQKLNRRPLMQRQTLLPNSWDTCTFAAWFRWKESPIKVTRMTKEHVKFVHKSVTCICVIHKQNPWPICTKTMRDRNVLDAATSIISRSTGKKTMRPWDS